MAALLSLRDGMFHLGGVPDPRQTSIFLAFIGGGLATVATVLGALFTFYHNKRERDRLGLDTLLRSLESLSADNLPRVAGVLASMIQLHQPRVAIRVLAPAWDAGIVDPGTATWLIGQVLTRNSAVKGAEGDRVDRATIEEAAVLLRRHAHELTGPNPRSYCFPDDFLKEWRTQPDLPSDAKRNLLVTIGTMLASRDAEWWGHGGIAPRWPTNVVIECARDDTDPLIASSAAILFNQIYSHFKAGIDIRFANIPQDIKDIQELGREAAADARFQTFSRLAGKIEAAWVPASAENYSPARE